VLPPRVRDGRGGRRHALTHSGLSITEWQPIVGTAAAAVGSRLGRRVRRSTAPRPSIARSTRTCRSPGFKRIFWWEYAHRPARAGRSASRSSCPFLWFALRRRLPQGYALPLAGIFVLGGLQGALGWYMVQSGPVDDPRVSQFRLTGASGPRVPDLRGDAAGRRCRCCSRARTRAPRAPAPAPRLAYALLVFAMVLTGGSSPACARASRTTRSR
jgi:cytochrome c oxidase assembly protein subunit 15